MHYRSPAELKVLGDYLRKFDFMKKQEELEAKDKLMKK